MRNDLAEGLTYLQMTFQVAERSDWRHTPDVKPIHTRFQKQGVLVALISAMILWGCESEEAQDTTSTDPTSTDSTEVSLYAVTFNTALGAGLAPFVAERRDAVAEALTESEAQVVCLQEVWAYEDVLFMETAVEEQFPYSHHSVTPVESNEPACAAEESDALSSCLEENCADLTEDALLLCAVGSCAEAFTAVSEGCQACIIANQEQPLSEILRLCAEENAVAYESQTGLVLLSKVPLERPDFLSFPSALGDRGVLRARLDLETAAPVDVYCTHLAASIGESLYDGEYGSWEAERAVQAEMLLDWIAQESESASALVLGDLNCGPETEGAEAEDVESYNLFIDAGFSSPYLESGNTECSWCTDNSLVTTSTPMLLDHALWKCPNTYTFDDAGRVFTEEVPLDVNGSTEETQLSDHYGIFARISISE